MARVVDCSKIKVKSVLNAYFDICRLHFFDILSSKISSYKKLVPFWTIIFFVFGISENKYLLFKKNINIGISLNQTAPLRRRQLDKIGLNAPNEYEKISLFCSEIISSEHF
jgi:hypothetical protein